eukprot:1862930-Prymnesium_polylepis.1
MSAFALGQIEQLHISAAARGCPKPIHVAHEGLVGAQHELHEDAGRPAVRHQLAGAPDAPQLRPHR